MCTCCFVYPAGSSTFSSSSLPFHSSYRRSNAEPPHWKLSWTSSRQGTLLSLCKYKILCSLKFSVYVKKIYAVDSINIFRITPTPIPLNETVKLCFINWSTGRFSFSIVPLLYIIVYLVTLGFVDLGLWLFILWNPFLCRSTETYKLINDMAAISIIE